MPVPSPLTRKPAPPAEPDLALTARAAHGENDIANLSPPDSSPMSGASDTR